MAAPPKQERAEAQTIAGRRSTRLFISIPISVGGKDSAGHTFKENTKTLIINKHGAKVVVTHQLALGAEVTLENRALGRTARAYVVWLGDRASGKDSFEIGLQLAEAQNLWGIEFPPDDWQDGPPIGPGGQKWDKPIPMAPPKISESPVAPKAPVKPEPLPPPKISATQPIQSPPSISIPLPTPPSTRVSSEVAGGIADAALDRLNRMAGDAVQANLKSFEDQLANLTSQFSARLRTSLEQGAKHLEEKIAGSLEQRLGALEGRLKNSRQEAEALLARLQELAKSGQAEVQKTERSIQDVGGKALLSAMKELEQKVRKELDAVSSGFVQQTRKRVQDEANSALEALGRQASSRLEVLIKDVLAKVAPELEARQKKLTEQAKAQISSSLEATSAEVRKRIGAIATEVTPALRSEMEASLVEYGGQIITRMTQSFEEQSQTSIQSASRSLQATLAKVQQAIQQEISNAAAKVRRSYELEAQKANKGVSEQIAKSIEQTFKSESDTYRKMLAELSESALAEFQGKASGLQEGFEGRLEAAVEASQEKVTGEVSEKLGRTADDLLESLRTQLGQQAEETLEMLNSALRSEASGLVGETDKRIRAAIQAGLDSLTAEAQTTSQEYRGHLRKAFEEFRDESGREIHARLEEISESQREAVLAQVERGIDDLINKTLGRFKQDTDRAAREASDTVNRQVGAAAVALREWEDQAKARLDSHGHSVEARARNSVDGVLEELRKGSDKLMIELQARLEHASRVFQDKGMEAMDAKLQAAADELVEAAAAQLRKQSEENLDLVSDQLRERQQQAVSQAENLFRNSLADMLRALIRIEPPKPADPDTRESPPAKKRGR